MGNQTIGERLKMLRKDANLSVDDLATLIGKNRATIYRYEKGEIQMPFDLLEPLAKAFGITPADVAGVFEDDALILSGKEKKLIQSYRNNPQMQNAIDTLLHIT